MSFRDFNSGGAITLVSVTALMLLLGVVLGKNRAQYARTAKGPSALHAEGLPADLAGNTNAPVRPLARTDSLKSLEEELSRSFRSFSPRDSSEGGIPQRSAPVIIHRNNTKKKATDDKDLMFLTPEDLTKTPSLEELVKIKEYDKDGREKAKTSAMDRYFARLESARSQSGKSVDRILEDDSTKPKADENVPDSIRKSEEDLRSAMGLGSAFGSSSSSTDDKNPLRSFSSSGLTGSSFDERRSRRDDRDNAVDQYRKFLNSSSPVAAANAPKPFASLQNLTDLNASPNAGVTPGLPAFSGLPGVNTSGRDINVPFGQTRSFDAPTAAQDPTRQVLNQWNPLYSSPTTEYKRPAPTSPTFTAPKRRF